MWVCDICSKPFAKESSHKRHISYCRRTQNRPRTRPKSCRSCNVAKVKCTFQTPCRRCVAKGINCVYELPSKIVTPAGNRQAAPNNLDEQPALDFSELAAPFEDFNTRDLDISIEEDFGVPEVLDFPDSISGVGKFPATTAFDLPNSTSPEKSLSIDPVAVHMDDSFTHGYDGNKEISTVTTISSTNHTVPFWQYTTIQPQMGNISQAPWATWTTSSVNDLILRAPDEEEVLDIPRTRCLVLLQPSSRIVRHNIHLVVQALRAYPLMMLRRETLPPFIHPHWHLEYKESLPQILSNCMSLAQMYASRSEETKPFVWRTVQAENEWLLTERKNFSPENLLAAVQAVIIYMIMRFVDGSPQPYDLNQSLVRTYQYLCKQFRAICGPAFCVADQYFVRPSWEVWIFEESRRRTACLFFLIFRCVSVDTGIPGCNIFEWFRELPLPSPKTLWEAKTRAEWESDYSAHCANYDTVIPTMGELVDAHQHHDDPMKMQLLDYWNSRADNLGSLLNIFASIA